MRRLIALLAIALSTSLAAQDRTGWQSDVRFLHDDLSRNHPGIFERTTPAELAAARDALIAKAPGLSWQQYVADLGKFIALTRDGHSNVFPPAVPGPGFDKGYGVQVFFFQDGVYATRVAAGLEDLAGKRIVAINGRPPSAVVEAMTAAISHDNPMWALELVPLGISTPGLLNGVGLSESPEAPLRLTIDLGEGQTRTIAISARPWGEIAPASLINVLDVLQPRREKGSMFDDGPNIEMRRINGGRVLQVIYRRVRDEDEKIADFAKRLERALADPTVERLIIDIRANNGGNNTLSQPLVHAIIRAERINRPGRLYVLTGRKTYSAAMNFATTMEKETQALFVGEPTGGSPNHFGDAELITLPNTKIPYYRSTVRWQDSRPKDHRAWIHPDINVAPTFAALKDGRDPALEAALSYQLPANPPTQPPIVRWQRQSQSQSWEVAIR